MPNAEAFRRRLQGSTLQLVPSMLRCHTGSVWCGWATVEGQPILATAADDGIRAQCMECEGGWGDS